MATIPPTISSRSSSSEPASGPSARIAQITEMVNGTSFSPREKEIMIDLMCLNEGLPTKNVHGRDKEEANEEQLPYMDTIRPLIPAEYNGTRRTTLDHHLEYANGLNLVNVTISHSLHNEEKVTTLLTDTQMYLLQERRVEREIEVERQQVPHGIQRIPPCAVEARIRGRLG